MAAKICKLARILTWLVFLSSDSLPKRRFLHICSIDTTVTHFTNVLSMVVRRSVI